MLQASRGDRVKVHYTGKFADGTVLATSIGREPLHIVLGAGCGIPGFESAVEGMTLGRDQTHRGPDE
jgi:peptidylprolyl isomerase